MSVRVEVGSVASCELIKGGAPVKTAPKSVGHFVVEHWRDGKRYNEYHFPNASTTEGRNKMLNTMFRALTQVAAANWHLGLISLANYTALAATDIYDNIDQAGNGWDEFATYTDGNNSDDATTRPAWGPGDASAAAVTNATAAVFNITTAGTVKGVFCCAGTGADLKSNHANTGSLWATGLFTSGDVVVANGDQLKITYTTTLAG